MGKECSNKQLLLDQSLIKENCKQLKENVLDMKQQITEDVPDLTVRECEELTYLVKMEECISRLEELFQVVDKDAICENDAKKLEDYLHNIYLLSSLSRYHPEELFPEEREKNSFFRSCMKNLAKQYGDQLFTYCHEVKPLLHDYAKEEKLREIRLVCRRIQLMEKIHQVIIGNMDKEPGADELCFEMGRTEHYEKELWIA